MLKKEWKIEKVLATTLMLSLDLLIFDLDGTLVDTRQDLTNSVNFTRSEYGLPPLTLTQVMQHVGDGMRKLLQRSLPDVGPEAIKQAIATFREHYGEHQVDHSRLYPGVRETLKHFRSKKLAVLSNKPEEFTLTVVEQLGIGQYFQAVLGGDSVAALKPSPEPILHILRILEVNPDKCIMIGDGPTDIESGRAAGIWTCGVTYGFRPPEVIRNCNPDFLIDGLAELKNLVL